MTATLDLATLRGTIIPRLWTPPLVDELTPETTMGFKWERWAREGLKRPADPWQRWLMMHGGELLPDGRPRFEELLVIVARQNGKTELPAILSSYWQIVERVPLILGTSSKLDYAKESWVKAVKYVEAVPKLAKHHPARWTRDANGEQESWTYPDAKTGSRYKIAAANKDAGRSLTVHRLIMDELRQHEDYIAWNAAEPTTSTVRDSQIWCLSNAGTDKSVVLNDKRALALEFIEWWERLGREEALRRLHEAPGGYRLGLFEWSSPPDADPDDIDALLQANPNVGYRIELESLLAKARRAKSKGGLLLAGFKTEYMCITVPKSSEEPSAIDEGRWVQLLDRYSQSGPDVALAVDVAPGRRSAAISVFSMRPDGRGHAEVVAHRQGTAWLVPALVTLRAVQDPVCIAIDDKSALEGLLKQVGIQVPEDPEAPERGDLIILRAPDVAAAWGEFVDAISPEADAIRHIGQLPLEAAVSSSRTRELGDAEALARRKSAGDITPLVSVVHARWAFHQRSAIIAPSEIDPGAWYL